MPAPERPERIGIFGGTFDPPHNGHAAAAAAVREVLELDRLLLVVANDPWQKSPSRRVTPAEDRFAMTEALAATVPGTEASRMEIDRGGPSYTVETAEALRRAALGADRLAPDLFLIVGADLVPELHTWERVSDLSDLVTLAVVSRPLSHNPAPPTGWRFRRVDGPAVHVSSSEVRERLARGEPIADLVPDSVVRCIGLRGLYAVGR